MEGIGDIIRRAGELVGYAVCHRLLSRSPLFGDNQFMLCSRCAGTYLGALSSYIYIFIKFRVGQTKLPDLKYSIFIIIFIASIFIDVGGTLLGIIPDIAQIRTLTGALAGSSIVLLAYSLLTPIEREKDAPPVIERWGELTIILSVSVIIALLVNSGYSFLYMPLTILATLGVLAIFFNTFYLITITISEPETKSRRIIAYLISISLMIVFLTLLWHSHSWMDGFLKGLKH